MNRFRPAARTVSPEGRRWEIYAYKLDLPARGTPDPSSVGVFPGYRAEAASDVLDGFLYLLAFLPRLLLRLCVDLPVAALRAARSDEWTIEAVSWAPYPTGHKWSTTREFRGQVLAQVEGSLARGETPRPRNARVRESGV
jgi:hypothetical protein